MRFISKTIQSAEKCLGITVLGLGLLYAASPAGATEKLTVLTSYPQEVMTHFEEAFEASYPAYKLEFIWKQSNDARAFLNEPNPVDVYWAPSKSNFSELSKAGLFQQLDDAILNANRFVNGIEINDPAGFYVATEVAGLGMVVNKEEVHKLGLPLPQNWGDLLDARYQGKIAFPVPSKIGFATGLLDAMMQGKTWEAGWSTILGTAANSTLIGSGSTFITDEVATGRQAIGLTMDFFAASAIAKGADLTYIYPPIVTYSPAHVAILKNSPNPQGAKAFLEFTLSEQGQRLLFHPDIRKLPVKQSVYVNKPAGYFNPFSVNESYKPIVRNLTQLLIINSLFDAMVTKHEAKFHKLYSKFYKARQANPKSPMLNEVSKLIRLPVITETEANDPILLNAFKSRKKDPIADNLVNEYESAWTATAAIRYEKADHMLDAILAN